ncbi:GntR family transcriptional regulator [Streptomyces cinereoruber]|uniref:GntR family transcriptional regulator n=1 Tax=Streptomyces cinereoruber TaxID=67260 RepID=UPI00362C8AEA
MSESSPRGTYLRIADTLRKSIENSVQGAPLPSEAALMQAHGVSRNTIRRALKALEAEQRITSVPGAGWRVSAGPARPLTELMTLLIAEEGLSPGDSFPSEASLCERFRVSRTAVRRALAQMEGSGLLDTIHGKGRTVRALPVQPQRP